MPRVNTPSPRKNRNRNNHDIDVDDDDDFEAMPIRQSMNTLMTMTQSTVRGSSSTVTNNNDQTGELETFIQRIHGMNQDEIKSELQKSFNNNDENRFKQLIKGLFRGYQNYSHHWLALQKNNKYDGKHQIDDDGDNDDDNDKDEDDEDEIMNRKNSKKGESSFMNKSVTFFKEFCKLINSPNTTKEESNWINKAISSYLDEVEFAFGFRLK